MTGIRVFLGGGMIADGKISFLMSDICRNGHGIVQMVIWVIR
jgi:hypothetical protein